MSIEVLTKMASESPSMVASEMAAENTASETSAMSPVVITNTEAIPNINQFGQTDRFTRQLDIVPADVHNRQIVIIGCGAIGRQTAIMAGALGPLELALVDFDTVEDHNRTTQGYGLNDIGVLKIEALASHIGSLYDDFEITLIEERLGRKSDFSFIKPGAIICFCLDQIRYRELIWQGLVDSNIPYGFIVDGRMLAENMRIIAGDYDYLTANYQDTLFSQDEQMQGSCTGRMTLYSASVCAGLMISKVVRWLQDCDGRNVTMFNDCMLSMPAEEYSETTTGFAV